jgi:selenocysteine lyase/cysteine desulfurase
MSPLDRKNFLRTAAGATAGMLAGRAGAAPIAGRRPDPLPAFDARAPENFWRSVRAQFLFEPGYTYFNTGGLGPVPEPVLTAVEATTRRLQERAETGYSLFAEARAPVARFLGAEPAEIAFVRNATEGNSIIAAGLALRAGDEVIFESHAHPGGSYPWLHQRTLRGIVVKLFEPDPTSAAGNLERIAALLTPRTRVVQVSHVTAPTGIVLPVAELARLCRERGIWFHVDGAQSAGMFPFALRALGCDSYATSGHKWLCGPHESGVLFVRRERLGEVAPVLLGAHAAELERLPGDPQIAATALRFEYGTRNAATAAGLAAAVAWHEEIGPERIAARGRALVAQVRAGLAALPEVEILTPAAPDLAASIVTFRSRRLAHGPLCDRVLKEHRMRCRPVSEQGLDGVRVSTHFFNSPAECTALVAAIGAVLKTA